MIALIDLITLSKYMYFPMAGQKVCFVIIITILRIQLNQPMKCLHCGRGDFLVVPIRVSGSWHWFSDYARKHYNKYLKTPHELWSSVDSNKYSIYLWRHRNYIARAGIIQTSSWTHWFIRWHLFNAIYFLRELAISAFNA